MINTAVTIIGQPEVTDWFIALQVKCPCGKQFQLVGQIGSMRPCEGTTPDGPCRRIYRVSGLPVLQQDRSEGLAPIVVSVNGTTFSSGIAYGTLPQE